MRAFIALELPDCFRAEVAAAARQLARACGGRFVPYENYHVTLAFLGEVDEAKSVRAVDALEAACAGASPCELRANGLGKFGRPQDATLWLGLEPTPGLTELAQRVRDELDARELAFDGKPFLPHVTIARRARLPRGDLPAFEFPQPARAREATLFKSVLNPDGASYKPLGTCEIVGGPSESAARA